ncbi:hypothetical protein PHYSODRAFT_307122 [Phytophthora sojae]|uniref:N-acetyltransferase domain-containing protein n=1 Tax=Phytophthora sojae (strain P6497) TaxID=1094619 RepID=G5ACU4_PHYSP|nr:hypothetical protein PHYSODRAFT_307122 [Phytophthora sojae]EGZ07168.1 hypothetical protein PHYSODRAFT_307122 [Phytophthora sojae]|eukprot:XP_009537932.1 hypothetical protein PHYSODRAFT_307122 [Phytophthora sojae]
MSQFRVVQLTQEALKVQCKTDGHEHWGSPLLDVQQWQKKGEAQRATRFSQDGALFWALVDKTEENPQTSNPSVPLRLPSKLGEIERGFSYQISSVYTLPEFRKRGLAGFFLTEVAKQLEQLPQALISGLYSDVGPTFYDKLGWKCHPSKLATLEIDHPRNTKAVDNNNSSTELKSLVLDDKLDKFLEADNARLVDALANSEKFQIEVAERKLSLSNAMVFRRGNVDDSKTTALPHWFCNEKYAWV